VRALIASLLSMFVIGGLTSSAQAQTPPTPDPNFATKITESPCKLEPSDDAVVRAGYQAEGFGDQDPAHPFERYPGHCRRIHFVYGPILVKPGQNDVLVGPITIEKPAEEGYVTRFKPNLVDQTGATPPVEQVHLHHGTWLALNNEYGIGNKYSNSAFFAAGEEKTIAPFPKGYGMPVSPADQWQLLYMVHSAVQKPMLTYITYDTDFVPKADGDALGMVPAKPIWLDVRPSAYPVFNVERKYGGDDHACTWPEEKCADLNSFGQTETGQGLPGLGLGKGTDYNYKPTDFGFPDGTGATLIGIGGHLHPGGIENEIDLVRGSQQQRIYNGVPTYWRRDDRTKPGGPATSWDFSMRVSGLPYYGVQIKPGDKLRSNAKYATDVMSSYEDMGIAVGLLVPNKPDGTPQAPGLDPFTVPVDNSERCDSKGLLHKDDAGNPAPELCVNGFFETHGHYQENGNASGPDGSTKVDAADGQTTTEIGVADFLYTPGDLSTVGTTGIPLVKLGSSLRFTNADGAAGIPHTITTCAYPCQGPTGAAFPLPNGTTSDGRQIDLDSAQLGYGAPTISGYKNETIWSTPVTEAEGYKPGEVVTYFCRIHPSMRGAFKVVQ